MLVGIILFERVATFTKKALSRFSHVVENRLDFLRVVKSGFYSLLLIIVMAS